MGLNFDREKTGDLPKTIRNKFLHGEFISQHRGNFKFYILIIKGCCFNILAFVTIFDLRDIPVLECYSTWLECLLHCICDCACEPILVVMYFKLIICI